MDKPRPNRKAYFYTYQHSEKGRAAAHAAQAKYRASAKGRAAADRARAAYRKRRRDMLPPDVLLDIRRQRIMLGLPPDVPPMPKGARTIEETPTDERLRPAYIAAALALEDLQNDLGL